MRSYYSKDWHCDCKPDKHTLENYIKGLHNVYDGQYEKAKITHDEKFIYVNTKENCISASSIFASEFHGLVLSSIHSNARKEPFGSEITFLFELPIKEQYEKM